MFFKTIWHKPQDYLEQKLIEKYVEANPDSELAVQVLELHEKWIKIEDAMSIDPMFRIYMASNELTGGKWEDAIEKMVDQLDFVINIF